MKQGSGQGSTKDVTLGTEVIVGNPRPKRQLVGGDGWCRVRVDGNNLLEFLQIVNIFFLDGCNDGGILTLGSKGDNYPAAHPDVCGKGGGQYVGKLPLQREGK
jgi:hypothetical protein